MIAVSLALVCLLAAPVGAQPEDEPEIADLELEQLVVVKITVATGSTQPISQAPAVASVITAEQIEAMGATHLDQVLETVPGLHVIPSDANLDPLYSIRGQSRFQVRALTLVNAVPITQVLSGARSVGFRIPVANIARIEVIRGPGSAVYGADAIAGVINIITKDADDLAGTTIGLRSGSFDTQMAWIQHGRKWSGWDVGLSLEWQRSGGDRDRILTSDFQTGLDQTFGTSASLAPGPLETRYDVLNAHLDLNRRRWNLHLSSWSNHDRGLGTSSSRALDPTGRQDADQLMLNLTYRNEDRFDGWDLTSRFSYLYLRQDNRQALYPPGTVLPIGPDGNLGFTPDANIVFFPDGFIANPGDRERTAMLDQIAIFDGSERHRFRFGVGLILQDVDTHETLNFGPGVIDGTQPVVDGTLTDVTDTPFIYMEDQTRDHWYALAQDEWAITSELQLTTGIRFDSYSDSGDTWNPRVALVWSPRSNVSSKLLYGRSFRPPSFLEQFFINNPVALGNRDLEAETADTIELVLDVLPRPRVRTVLNLFTYELRDQIVFLPEPDGSGLRAQNARDQDGFGFEFETTWAPRDSFRLRGNFSWQHSEDAATDARIPAVPVRQLFVNAWWEFRPLWSIYGELNWIADREREPTDLRPAISDYSLVSLTLRRKRIAASWDLALSARNLFDEKAFEPSDGLIPDDYPLEGRSAFVELIYHWDH